MSVSPNQGAGGEVRLTVFVDGTALAETIDVVTVTVTAPVNRIPSAEIVTLDGDMPNQDFPLSNETFAPGSKVKINAGYDDEEDTIFEGIVTRHGIRIGNDGGSQLVVECRDPAVAMTVGRKNAVFLNQKDSDILSSIIGDYADLSNDVTSTDTTHGELVQYYCSDWDFVLSRAEANGMLTIASSGKLTIAPPDTSAGPELSVTYGEDLMELNADLETHDQLSAVAGAGWDLQSLAVVEETVEPEGLNKQGDVSAADIAKVSAPDTFQLQTPAPMEKTSLKSWAKGLQVKSELSRIRGSMAFRGSSKALPGCMIELAGVGEHFSGTVYVGSVTHTIENGGWTTEVEMGIPPEPFSENRNLTAPPASGLVPGIEGLYVGIVKKLNEDPDSQYRIQVTIPILQDSSDGVWARLSGMYASKGFGAFFIPEVGDEVVLGFFNNDPSHPVVLGSLYSSGRKPAYELEAENNSKALVTRSELKLEFDDDKKIVTVTTPGKNKIVLNDDEKSILLQDQNSNKVTLNDSGIQLQSQKDVTIKAMGKITLDATGELGLSSKADVKVSGLNVSNEAKVGFTAKGNASAELSASGQTTVKGAMVMIN